jgi:tRNA (guanine-N7-)-methyltransferase
MGQKKLIRFKAIGSFQNVLQYPENMAGNWKDFFQNENPITLELACGKGEYTVGLSEMHSQRNFIGVDLKGNRIYAGALECLNRNQKNAAFLRTHIAQIDRYFLPGEVSEIWITFPDPQLRTSRAKKRLTHPRYLRLYQQILQVNGVVHLKTDSPELYHFTKLMADFHDMDIREASEDIYASAEIAPELQIKTHYEKLDIAESNKVYYIRFALPEAIIPEPTKQLQELLKKIENQESELCQ